MKTSVSIEINPLIIPGVLKKEKRLWQHKRMLYTAIMVPSIWQLCPLPMSGHRWYGLWMKTRVARGSFPDHTRINGTHEGRPMVSLSQRPSLETC